MNLRGAFQGIGEIEVVEFHHMTPNTIRMWSSTVANWTDRGLR